METEEEITGLVTRVNKVSRDLELTINKTEKEPSPAHIDRIDVVKEFICLNSQMLEAARWKEGKCHRLNRRHQSKADKNTRLSHPIVTYGAESWILKAADRKRIDIFKLFGWRRVVSISWTEKRTSELLVERLDIKEQLTDDSVEKLVVQGKVEVKALHTLSSNLRV